MVVQVDSSIRKYGRRQGSGMNHFCVTTVYEREHDKKGSELEKLYQNYKLGVFCTGVNNALRAVGCVIDVFKY